MYLIDTHTHLFDEAFDVDRNVVVQNALDAGVEKMILPCVNPQSLSRIDDMLALWSNNCFATAGLHPEDIGEDYKGQINEIFGYKFRKPIVAVGEIGIDLYWRQDNVNLQIEVFEYQLKKAVEMQLPVIIHCRNAYNEIFEVFEKFDITKLSGVFHCFSGNVEEARRIIEYKSFMFGIGGVVTFKKSGAEIADIVSNFLPIEKIVLETDSPYLAPTPNRDKRNESAFVKIIAQKIAELKQLPLEKIIEITTANACRLFKID